MDSKCKKKALKRVPRGKKNTEAQNTHANEVVKRFGRRER